MPKDAKKTVKASARAPGRVNRIGTEKESSLHHALKFRYAKSGGKTEVPFGLYVADGVREDGEIIEVQTGSFGPLKQKVHELRKNAPVRIIHPIIIAKYIDVFDTDGQLLYRRKSPRRGSEWDLFKALLYAPELAACPGVMIELALVDVLEKRIKDGKGSWRRKGISLAGRELAAWHDTIILKKRADYRRFLPFASDETFTVNDLGKQARITVDLARKTLYVLTKMEVIERIGKKGNAFLYKIRNRN
ncbi:MAG: hypothetical protein LBN21_06595 [Treponema sp.]|jgi:hypothetical protein|nr:hypothetical protein [Treponema sp.]